MIAPVSMLGFCAGLVVLAQPAAQSDLRIALPFADASSFLCKQGNHGSFSHSDGINDFAYDFTMPEGTPVLAAAAGRVLLVKMDSTRGGPTREFIEDANLIWIDHGNGFYSSYVHLQAHTALVRVGELVNAGTPIAKSGSTGFADGPHLHFALTDRLRRSRASHFVDVPGDGVPKAETSYTSHNVGKQLSWFEGDSELPPDAFAKSGITLSPGVPANVLPWDEFTTVSGRLSPGPQSVVFFFGHVGNISAFAQTLAPVAADGSFELKVKPSAMAAELASPPFCFGLAALDATGAFRCEEMPIVLFLKPERDEAGRPRLSVGSPFPGGEEHDYVRSGQSSLPDATGAVSITLPGQSAIRPVAAGRVIAVGKDSERPAFKGAKSLYVTLDHGGGVWTDYSGLVPGSVALHEGEIVHVATRLGASAAPVGGAESPFHLAFRCWSADASGVRFADAGAEGVLGAKGKLKSLDSSGSEHLFQSDSRVPSAAFESLGVTLDSSLPLSTFGSDEDYLITGNAAGGGREVAFLARRRADKKIALSVSVPVKDGTFSLDVRFAEHETALGSGPWEWTLTAHKDAKGFVASSWLPLVIVR